MTQHLGTYAELFADSILKRYDIDLPKKNLAAHLTGAHSFYKYMCELNALNIHNTMHLALCHDLRKVCQDAVIDMFLMLQEDEDDENDPSPTFETYLNVQQEVTDLARGSFEKETDVQELQEEIDIRMQEDLEDWQSLQRDHAEIITQQLENKNIELPEHFTENLTENLIQMGANVTIPNELAEQLKLKSPINDVTRALIGALHPEVMQA